MYSLSQIANLINKTRQQVWNIVQAGKLNAVVLEGGKRKEYRVTEESLQEYLDTIENLKRKEA